MSSTIQLLIRGDYSSWFRRRRKIVYANGAAQNLSHLGWTGKAAWRCLQLGSKSPDSALQCPGDELRRGIEDFCQRAYLQTLELLQLKYHAFHRWEDRQRSRCL